MYDELMENMQKDLIIPRIFVWTVFLLSILQKIITFALVSPKASG